MRLSIRTLVFLGILSVLLSACAAAATEAPTAVPSATLPVPTDTAAPTATETLAPTATSEPTATPTAALYTYQDILIPHPVEGREACDTCHGPEGAKPYPEDHAGRTNETCQHCHLTQDEAVATPDVSAFTQTACLDCHGPFDELNALDIQAVAEDGNTANPHVYVPHDSATILECTLCHQTHPLPQPAAMTDKAEVTIEACYECHHLRNFTNCKQCHAIVPTGKHP